MEEIIVFLFIESKLRKREETSTVSPGQIESQTTTTTFASQATVNQQLHHNGLLNGNNGLKRPIICNNNGTIVNGSPAFHTSVSDSNMMMNHNGNGSLACVNGSSDPSFNASNQNSVWIFPPLPPQPNIYNCNNNIEAIMQQNEKHGFKGFKKQFSGRFKRLVAKKPQEPAPAIPPELKPQLKTIYVY